MNMLIGIVYWVSVAIVAVWAAIVLAIFVVWLTIFFVDDKSEGDENKHYREFD